MRRIEVGVLALILLLYAILAWGYATRTPDWQVPDEPAHYNYVRQIVETGDLPVIQMGDWQQDYQVMLTRCNFNPSTLVPGAAPVNQPYLDACDYDPALVTGLDTIQYEDHQPPLYYLLQSAVYRVFDGDLETMRLFSAFLGAGAIICAWAIVRRLFPHWPLLGLAAAAFVAFLPQRLAIMAGVSNDSLAETLGGLVLLAVTIYLLKAEANFWMPLMMGFLVGLVFLTKSTVYFTAGIAGLAILLRWHRERWRWQLALQQVALFAVPALLLGMIWWIHSIDVYGSIDFLGLQRHDEVVEGQLRTEDYINNELGGSRSQYLNNLFHTTFHSFWGQFGWMALPMKPRIYQALQVLVGLLLVGAVRYKWLTDFRREQREVLILLTLSIVLVVAQFLLYNRSFVQFQGRYLYPALIPLALIVAVGLAGWTSLVGRWQPYSRWLPVCAAMLMVFFAWYALCEVVSVLPVWE